MTKVRFSFPRVSVAVAALVGSALLGDGRPAPALELEADYATHGNKSYWAANNVWNKGVLKNGTDYTQRITADETGFPNNTTMSWSWPRGPSVQIYAYPEIIFGSAFSPGPSGKSEISPAQVANFENLTVTYAVKIFGETDDFNVAFDLWLTTQPNGPLSTAKYELMIWIHAGKLKPGLARYAYSLADIGLRAKVFIKHDSGVSSEPNAPRWTYIACVTDADLLSGSISISNIIKSLIWNGVLSGNEYLSGVEFGPEISQGKGTLQIEKLDYVWQAREPHVGSPANETFEVSHAGGNHVVGAGGYDAVIYPGAYSAYQIKRSASKLLLVKNGDISTLDVLDGISVVRFADGTYDVDRSAFTKGGR